MWKYDALHIKAGPFKSATPHLYTMTYAFDRFTNNRWRA